MFAARRAPPCSSTSATRSRATLDRPRAVQDRRARAVPQRARRADIRSLVGRVLLAEQLGSRPDHLRGDRDRDRCRRSPGAPPAGAPRDVAGAVRSAAGGDSGDRRADPRLRPDARRRAVRGSPSRGGLRRERDRDDLPAGPTPGRAGSEPVARAAALLHRARPANVARGAGQLANGAHDRGRGRRPAAALEPGRSRRSALRRSRPRRGSTWTR